MNRSLTLCFFLNQTKRVISITITQINGERGQHYHNTLTKRVIQNAGRGCLSSSKFFKTTESFEKNAFLQLYLQLVENSIKGLLNCIPYICSLSLYTVYLYTDISDLLSKTFWMLRYMDIFKARLPIARSFSKISWFPWHVKNIKTSMGHRKGGFCAHLSWTGNQQNPFQGTTDPANPVSFKKSAEILDICLLIVFLLCAIMH